MLAFLRIRRWVSASFVPLCFLVVVHAVSAETLRVATYNLDNYTVTDRRIDGGWRPEYPKPEVEKRALRRMILATRPDILAVQEIGGLPFLEELRADLEADGLAYAHAFAVEAVDEERRIGLLTREEPHAVTLHEDLDFAYLDGRAKVKRGMLEAVFESPGGGLWKFFVVHLKSRRTVDGRDPESRLRRAREARACRNRIIERGPGAGVPRFLVAGDFNDHPASAPLRRFYQKGDRQLGRLVEAVDRRGELWTYFYAREARYSLVDGFVASPELAREVLVEPGRIVDLPGALAASDHRMVCIDLEFPDPERPDSVRKTGTGTDGRGQEER